MKELPPLLQIGDILLSTDIITVCFACDYPVCKGACCVIGDSGAPMDVLKGVVSAGDPLNDETSMLAAQYASYSSLMTEGGRESIAALGFSVIDREGDLVTPLVSGSEECAFCRFDGDNCLCSIELAGKSKPISCSLYPIRLKRLFSGMLAMNLHRWDICRCAYDKGRREGIRVYEFLKGPIVRAFGEEFWQQIDAARRYFEG